MELRQLEYFQVVSRLKSVTKAANQLCVAQPSVTVAIKKLEEELGVQLLDRTFRQIVLTAEGQVFSQRVDAILNSVQDLFAEMSDYRLLNKGCIKIGITPIIGAVIFPYIFEKFYKIYPNLETIFIEEGSLAIRSLLERGEVDVGILITSNISPHFETVSITTGQILVCLPQNHPLGKLTHIPFNDLRDYPFILFKEDTYSRQMILEECSKHDFIPNIVFSSRQIETIAGLVEQGVGISFLPDAIVKKHSDILSRPLSSPLYIQAGLAWNKERYLSSASKAFINFVTENFS